MVDKGVKLTRVYFVNCSPSDTTYSLTNGNTFIHEIWYSDIVTLWV